VVASVDTYLKYAEAIGLTSAQTGLTGPKRRSETKTGAKRRSSLSKRDNRSVPRPASAATLRSFNACGSATRKGTANVEGRHVKDRSVEDRLRV